MASTSVSDSEAQADLTEDTFPSPAYKRLIRAYLALNFTAGHILLPTLLCIFLFSRGCRRHPTLINVIIALIWSSVLSCLLLWTGQTGGKRLRGTRSLTCAIQGGLLIGCLPMISTAVFALTCYTWRTVTSAYGAGGSFTPLGQSLLMVAPYLAYAPWIPGGIYFSFRDLMQVSRSPANFYCTIRDDKSLEYAMGVFSGLVNIATVILEVHLGWIYFRNRRIIRSITQSDELNVGFIVRVIIFGTYSAIAPAVSLLTSVKANNPIGGLFAATVSTVFAIIFGSRRDVLVTLIFWRRSPVKSIPGHSHSHSDSSATLNVSLGADPEAFIISPSTLYHPGNVERLELEDRKNLITGRHGQVSQNIKTPTRAGL